MNLFFEMSVITMDPTFGLMAIVDVMYEFLSYTSSAESNFSAIHRKPNAVVDGRLVTGQNPQSSLEVIKRIIDPHSIDLIRW